MMIRAVVGAVGVVGVVMSATHTPSGSPNVPSMASSEITALLRLMPPTSHETHTADE